MLNLPVCVIELKNILFVISFLFIGLIIFFAFRLYIFRIFLSFLALNAIISFALHSQELGVCLDAEKFFYLWFVLWMLEIPFILGLYLLKLFLNRAYWDILERRKFIIAFGIWFIEISLLLKFLG